MDTLNEITISYNRTNFKGFSKIESPETSYSTIKEIYTSCKLEIDLKEYFVVILLNRANDVIGFFKLSEGGISSTIVDVRLLFSTALKCLASSIIITHNHPSGKVNPSINDNAITKKIKEAGELLDITLLDHLIVSKESYFSYSESSKIL
jgi:DNA repair protein RadC